MIFYVCYVQMSSVNDIILGLTTGTDKALRNNAGGVFNHLVYFKVIPAHPNQLSDLPFPQLLCSLDTVKDCIPSEGGSIQSMHRG